jgi:hypothetical protein
MQVSLRSDEDNRYVFTWRNINFLLFRLLALPRLPSMVKIAILMDKNMPRFLCYFHDN